MTFPAEFPFCFADIDCATLIPHESDSSITPYVAVQLTRSGSPTYNYSLADRIFSIDIHQDPFSDNATLILFNDDQALTDIDFRAYKATFYFGITYEGSNYYATLAPQWVIDQALTSEPGGLFCELNMIGIISWLFRDKASEEYKGSGNSKNILTAILNASLSPFDHCTNWNPVWHGDAGVHSINIYAPSDAFKIPVNSSRLNAVRQLLNFDISFMRPENDGKLHLRRPVTSGTDYEWEFSLDSHVFYVKRQNKSVVIPNYILCQCETETTTYSGYAQDDDSVDTYGEVRAFVNVSGIESNGQATAISQGVLNNIIQNQYKGDMKIPPVFYLQLLEYIKVTDDREGSELIGNVGFIDWHWSEGEFWQRVGIGGWANIRKIIADFWRDYQPKEEKLYFPYWFTATLPGTKLKSGEYICFQIVLVPKSRTLFIGSYGIHSSTPGAGQLRILEWDTDYGNWVDLVSMGSPISVPGESSGVYYNGQAIDAYDSYDTGGTPIAFVVENETEGDIEQLSAHVSYDCQYLPGGLP